MGCGRTVSEVSDLRWGDMSGVLAIVESIVKRLNAGVDSLDDPAEVDRKWRHSTERKGH